VLFSYNNKGDLRGASWNKKYALGAKWGYGHGQSFGRSTPALFFPSELSPPPPTPVTR